MPYYSIDTIWNDGLSASEYFASLAYYRHFVQSLFRDVVVQPEDRRLVEGAIDRVAGGDRSRLRVIVLTEDWCGDSAVTVPYIARLAEEIGIDLRIFRQSIFTDLKEWYVTAGTTHIPVVSVLRPVGNAPVGDAPAQHSPAPEELFRWVERPTAAHAKVEGWIAEHPSFPDLYEKKDTDREAEKRYFKLYAALLREMAGWYRQGLWSHIAVEFADGITGDVL